MAEQQRPVRRVLTSADRDEIVRRYKAGDKLSIIAQDLKVKVNSVSQIVSRTCGSTRGPLRKVSKEDERKIAERVIAGERASLLAAEYNITAARVREYVKDYGYSLRLKRFI